MLDYTRLSDRIRNILCARNTKVDLQTDIVVDLIKQQLESQGWPNYPTRLVWTYISNDNSALTELRRATRTCELSPQELRVFVELHFDVPDNADMATDLARATLDEVDWGHLYRHLKEED
jgi:hypothetical protein